MALDESIDGLKEFKSNGVSAYLDPNLAEFLDKNGGAKVDFITNPMGQNGYSIKVGNSSCGDAGGCGGSCPGAAEHNDENSKAS